MNQAGTYNANLTRGVLSKAGNGGLQAALVFNIQHYQADGQWTEIAPFERTVFLSFAGGAKEYTKKKLATLGFNEPKVEKDPESGEQVMVFPEGTTTKAISLLCKHEEYNGGNKERWDFASWGGGNTGEAADDTDAMKFAALW